MLIFLYAEENVKGAFTPAPFASFCSGYSLKNHLVRAKVYPLIREEGAFCCGESRCETCCNIKQTDTFKGFVIKTVHKMSHSFNCDSKCLTYRFSFKVCGMQYVGFTVDRFWLRWNNYKSCQRNTADGGTPNQIYNRLMNDCEIIFIAKQILEGNSFGWGCLIKTIAPLSINTDDDYNEVLFTNYPHLSLW